MNAGLTIYALLFLFSFLNVLALTPVSVWLAEKLGAVDYPNERKIHLRPTPRLGGLAIAASILLTVVAGVIINPYMRSGMSAFGGVVVGCGIVLALGIYDDIRNAPPWVKLVGQILAATVVVQSGVVFSLASNPLSQKVINYFDLGMLSAPLTIVWIVGLTNAINLTDGLDGLATGICMFAATALFLISLQQRAGMVTYIYVIIAGATLAFLKFSRFPASVFLGDCGSMFLGFLLACLSVIGTQKTYTLTALFIPIIVFGVPVFDMLASLTRRYLGRSKLFQADKEHLHHLLLRLGISQKQAVWVLYGLTILLGIIAFTFTALLDEYAAVIVLIIGLLGGFLARELRAFATERTPMERGFRYRGESPEVIARRIWTAAGAVALGCVLSLTSLNAQSVEVERGLQPLVSALHVHSTFSNGRYDIASLVDMAEQRGIDVLGITDSFLTRARYGVGPWKKLVSRTMVRAGVMDAGIERYLDAAADAARLRNVVVLPGVEVTPYYYWRGNYFAGLQLFDFDRHLLIFGMNNPAALYNLPVIENATWSNTTRDWSAAAGPIALVVAGMLLVAIPLRRTVKLRKFQVTGRWRFRKIGIALGVVGLVWSYDAYPFGRLSDPYSGKHDTNAYQQVITYAKSLGAVSIWSYPEAQYPDVTQGGARMISRAHAEDLWLTHDYSSFEGLYGDRITATAPGGMWDRVLTEYATGHRQSWPTIITGLDFHDFGPTPWYELKYGQTILWSAKKDAASVLEAIARGRGYAVFQGHSDRNLLLKTFSLRSETAAAIAGETLTGNAADVTVSLEWDRKPVREETRVRVTIVRDGKIMDEIEGAPPIHIMRRDELTAGKHYYRVMATDGAVELLSNPIFWEK